jgi:ligand-binding sensor domain-containing protein/DNA-binding CsgD family transcriptional regulator
MKVVVKKASLFTRQVMLTGVGLLLFACQQVAVSQPLPFDHITINEGLSNNTVYSIVQDLDGFMWCGTRDGLNRYDGYEFKVYKSDAADGSSLPSDIVQSLYVHGNGDLWIGLRRGGIAVLGRETQMFELDPVVIDSVQDLSEVAIQSFFEDSYGDIWVGTAGLGVLQLDSTGNTRLQLASFLTDPSRRLLTNHCFSFAEDIGGNIWIGTDGDAVHVFDRDRATVESVRNRDGESMYSYRKSLLIQGDTLYIGTEGNGVFMLDIKSRSFWGHLLPGLLVRDVNLVRDDELFISTDGAGLYVYHTDIDSLVNYRFSSSSKNSLNTNALYDIYTDRDSNVWIGTFNGGLNVLKARAAPFLSYLPGTQSVQTPGAYSVLSFFEEDDGRVLAGMDGAGIWQFRPSLNKELMTSYPTGVPESVVGEVITALYRDSREALWIGTFAHGVTRVEPDGAFRNYLYNPDIPDGITNNNIWDITEDQSGNVWLAALGGAIMRYDRNDDSFTHFTPEPGNPQSLSDWNARVVFVDSKNRLWVATEDGGVNLFHRTTGTFTSWGFDPADSTGLRSNSVLCIFEDSSGSIWVGTEGAGLHRLVEDEDRFEQVSIRDGLQSNVINAIEEDRHGLLWISTNDGISSYNPANGDIHNFDSDDGLSSDQFNPDASIHSAGGEIIFGNIRGANGFIAEQVAVNPNPPAVVFTDFQLYNESVEIGRSGGREIISAPLNDSPTVSLSYRENVFTIAFAAIEFTNPSKNKYAYRMLGFEEEWNRVDATTRRATYTNLDPGDYTFEVRASNNNGVWSDQVRRLDITIAPPFYATTGFRVSASVLLILTLLGVIRFRDLRRKDRHNRQLLVAEQKILQLRNRNLKEEVERKNAELSAALLQSAHKNKALDGLKHQLAELSGHSGMKSDERTELRRLIRKIEGEIGSADYWERFQMNFNQIHRQFAEKIHQAHPKLTQNDIRLCCLLKINLTNREIATIQNISLGGVEKSKFRLKRKLDLEPDQDLNAYILNFA